MRSVLMVLAVCSFIENANAQSEYTPKISFKDIVESQVGVVKKVMNLSKEVSELRTALAKLQEQQEKTYAKLSSIEQELKQRAKTSNSKAIKSSVSVPSSYQDLIDKAKSWAK
ncbi:hypothetical protein [Hydrogenobaculum sp. Y04AAS1]|uniref:hypothetical protein n=1 Tax=Hydrogenobaculum sp. (strain Y04AAS1) TaxID=380749 RepID=UPI0012E9D894